ncbi:MAG: hypothetical protein FJW31_24315 [Acidobacteria bacterium]|nr:hypothetical protein [Acidobacteriota bacterium]
MRCVITRQKRRLTAKGNGYTVSTGYAISWLAVRREQEPAAFTALELAPTSTESEDPDAAHPWYATRTAAGWTVIWSNLYAPDCFSRFTGAFPHEAIGCDVEEHVMVICLEAYRDGELLWHVEHDAQEGPEHLHVEGTPPPEFDAIREESFAAPPDPGVDLIFDVPVRLGETAVGFRHDEGDHRFEVLRNVAPRASPPPAKPWWKVW